VRTGRKDGTGTSSGQRSTAKWLYSRAAIPSLLLRRKQAGDDEDIPDDFDAEVE
jgi:hypothetical protein